MDDKEKKDKSPKKEVLKPGDDSFPKYKNLKTIEETVSKHSSYQAVDQGLQKSAKITAKSYLARAKAKAKKNNNNNGQVLVKDPVSGKVRRFFQLKTHFTMPLRKKKTSKTLKITKKCH